MTYGTTITEHHLGKWGKMRFAQWNHPHEHRKEFTERDIDWLAQFIKPGDTAVDVGAFTGDTALPMAVAAGKNGTVYAFEPNQASLEILIQNSKLNDNIAHTIVYPHAIGVSRGSVIFRYHCEQINGGYLTNGDPVTINRVRLDECNITERVNFVKIDTEGEDGSLLEEFTPWLKEHGNPVVQVERYPHLSDVQKFVLWNAIINYGTPSLKDDWTFAGLKRLPETLVDIIVRP